MPGSLTSPCLSVLANAMPPLRLSHEVTTQGAGRPIEQLVFRDLSATDTILKTDGLFMLILWFSTFFFVVLMGLMVYWVIKYRRKPGVPAQPSPSHNTALEIIWTVVPSSSLLVIFLFGFWTYMDRQVESSGALELNVTGSMWAWDISYPNGAKSPWTTHLDPGNPNQVPVFVVPEDTDVALRMISQDVIHSFWIPDMRVKMDVFPNRYTGYTFRTPILNPDVDYVDHWVFCAEYCGDYHSEMAAIMRVVKKQDYAPILTEWASGGDPVETGKRIHSTKCFSCHSVDGTAKVGPTWLNLYGYTREMSTGDMVLADENYIRESILDPNAKHRKGQALGMASFNGALTEDEINGLIAYMKSISDKGPPPEAEGDAEEGAGDASEAPESEAGSGEDAADSGGSSDQSGDSEPADATPAGETHE